MADTNLVIALIGNPNAGKSTLFGALCGLHVRTGNYPGVTVEKRLGEFTLDGRKVTLVDLPGSYSLAPRSPDEMVAVDVLLGQEPGVPLVQGVLSIVDAGNLSRHMYLVSQVLDLGLPVVVALNMIDAIAERGITIDAAELSKRLGVPVIPIQANRGVGLDHLKAALAGMPGQVRSPNSPLPSRLREQAESLSQTLPPIAGAPLSPFLAQRLLLDSSGYLRQRLYPQIAPDHAAQLDAAQVAAADGQALPAQEAIARYGWVGAMLQDVLRHPSARRETWSDRVDRVLTHRIWGSLLFLALMLLMFTALFVWSDPLMALIESTVGMVGEAVASRMPEGPLRSLVVDGVIAGVGGVLVFLPQIMVLFAFIGALEDCGYMARAAFLMDRL